MPLSRLNLTIVTVWLTVRNPVVDLSLRRIPVAILSVHPIIPIMCLEVLPTGPQSVLS